VNPDMNREAWLHRAMPRITEMFTRNGYIVPEVRVSIGFPSRSALGKRVQRIGECWSDEAATDKVHHIFLSPVLLAGESPTRVLDVLVHEIVHAVVGLKAKHGQLFKKCATAVGLTGKMTATVATDALNAELASIVQEIGPCPGGGLDPKTASREKQTTRMRKYTCPQCEQIIRAATDGLDVKCVPCDTLFEQAV
jgi:predicted SprT family Zn-dependent metalloprotease